MRLDRGRPAHYGWWAPVAQCHKRGGGVLCFEVSRAQPPETPTDSPNPVRSQGGAGADGKFHRRRFSPSRRPLQGRRHPLHHLRPRVDLVNLYLSLSLSHSCIRSREELVMYSCIYVKNLFSMLDLVHRARSCVNSRTQNLTMESEPFSCIDPVGERSREER